MIRAALCAALMLAAWPDLTEACDAPAPDAVQVETGRDDIGRAVAPVYVNGQGPFRFIVDTGANRSVISARLAERLRIPVSGEGEVHSVSGVAVAPTGHLQTLGIGALSLANVNVPMLEGAVLAGEQGLLGFDGMTGRRLRIDFAARCVEIDDARSAAPLTGWSTTPTQVRFGSLIVARGQIQGVPVNVLIDTGSDISLANEAFRAALGRVRADVVIWRGDFAYTMGRPVMLDNAVWAPRIHLEGVRISNVMAYVGDYHIFDLWGLNDEPTVLIGVDVLAQSGAMAIDYERRLLHFRSPPRGRR